MGIPSIIIMDLIVHTEKVIELRREMTYYRPKARESRQRMTL